MKPRIMLTAVTGTLVAGVAVVSLSATDSPRTIGAAGQAQPAAQALLIGPESTGLSADVATTVGRARAEYRERVRAEEAARREAEQAARLVAAEQARRAAQESAANTAASNGITESAYTGAYYNPAHDGTRRCIIQRESGGNYGISSANGLWHGAYQFALGTSNGAAQLMGRPDLIGVTANNWSRHDQDMAFWVMWNNGAGAAHWGGYC